MSEPNEVQKNSVSEPSSSSDTPTGSLGKRATRGAINGIKNGIKNIGNMIPMHIKLLVFGPVLLIVCIFILVMAIFNLTLSSEKSDTAVSTSTTYVESQSFNSGNKAKEYFNNSSSLLLFNLKDINNMYNYTLKSSRDSTKDDFSYELGSTAVSNEESRIVDINEKLPIYKHILLTEKYNFNNVVWKVYGHSYNGEEIKDINSGNIKMKEDKDLGITYPEKGNNESDYKLDKFVNLVYPYLQTWYIPLAFLSASTTTGTEDTANNPQFSYNIIKEAYSKIVINRYEIEKRTVKTYYTEIDKVTKHNKITVQLNKKTITTRTTDEDGNIVGDDSSSVTYLVAPLAVGTTYSQDLTSTQSFSEVTDNTEHLNSRYDAGKNEDPKKETLVDDNISTTSKYYIAEAKTFDLKVINEFNYIQYDKNDVTNRVNPKSQKIENSEYTKDPENKENKEIVSIATDDIDSEGNSNVSSLFKSKIPNNGFSITKKEELNSNNPYVSTNEINIPVMDTVTSQEGGFPNITFKTHTITTTTTVTPYATYEINIDPFVEYENGVKHNVTRQWEDELSQTKSTNSAYTIDDLIEFNQSDDRQEKVSAQDLCGTSGSTACNTEDGQYYKLYEKNKELNLIDFINSNPGIYKNYTRSSYSDYVGYSRGYLLYHYNELKRLLGKLKAEDGLLPFVYGQSLGFGVQPIDTQISNSMSSSSGSGLSAMCKKAIELAQSNDGNGLWHYCQGTAGGEANHSNYARISFSTIEDMNKYIDLANKGQPVGTDCSAFVRSMYLTYTGIDIDPGGGASIRTIAQDNNNKHLPGYDNITVHYYEGIDYDNIKPGDVLVIPGQHVGLYVGKVNGKYMQVDQGGDSQSGLCGYANGSSWKGPKYHEVSSSYTAYIHYEGIPESSSSDTSQYVTNFEGTTPTKTENGVKYYQFVIGSEGNLAIGHGVDIDAGGFGPEFEAAGYTVAEGAWVPADFVDAISERVLDEKREKIAQKTSGLGLQEYQIEALVSRAYNCGETGALEGYEGTPTFKDAYNSYWKASDLKYKNKDQVNYNHRLYTEFMSIPTSSNGEYMAGLEKRRRSEWLLFQTGYYDNLNKYYGE